MLLIRNILEMNAYQTFFDLSSDFQIFWNHYYFKKVYCIAVVPKDLLRFWDHTEGAIVGTL